MRKILAATDFSEHAQAAVERAAVLAAGFPGVELTLLHVLTSAGIEVVRRMHAAQGDDLERVLRDDSERLLSEAATRLGERLGRRVLPRVAAGQASAEIAAAAEDLDADLVVLGARGEGFLRRLFLGTTSERVMRKTDRPLLAVKKASTEPYRRVLAAVDFSPYAPRVVDLACRVGLDAEITLLHAYEVPFESKLRLSGATEDAIEGYRRHAEKSARESVEELASNAAAPHDRLRRAIVRGTPATAILDEARAMRADLLVLGKHGHSMLAKLLLGSVLTSVIADAEVDVLVVGDPSAQT